MNGKEKPGFHEEEVGEEVELDDDYSLEDLERFEDESGHGLRVQRKKGKLFGKILRYIFIPKK